MKIYRKNSRKNPWRNTRNAKKIPVEQLLAIILVISIPLAAICISSNVVLRLPDVYQYNLRSTQALNKTGRVIKEEKVIKLFGDFMQGKTDDFKLKEDVSYQPENVFSKADQRAMTNLRNALNVMLVIGILSFLLTVLGYFFLIRWRKKELQRRAFKKAAALFLILTILNTAMKLVPRLRDITWGQLFNMKFPKRDVLVQILEKSFAFHVTLFEVLLSLILMALLGYMTWQVAGRKKLFKKF